MSGEAAGVALDDWLSDGDHSAKVVTNAVTNRSGDGPDTARGVRERVGRSGDQALIDLVAGIDDETLAVAVKGVRHLQQRWLELPPGGILRLAWPLPISEIEHPERVPTSP